MKYISKFKLFESTDNVIIQDLEDILIDYSDIIDIYHLPNQDGCYIDAREYLKVSHDLIDVIARCIDMMNGLGYKYMLNYCSPSIDRSITQNPHTLYSIKYFDNIYFIK